MPRRLHLSRAAAAPLGTLFLAVALLVLSPGKAASQSGLLCLGLTATVVGTAGDDQLVGTPGADVIAALDGSDAVDGLGGDDRLCGGAGHDELRGGAGADVLEGGAHDDGMAGGPGADTVSYARAPASVSAGLAVNASFGWGSDRFSQIENLVGSRFADHIGGDDRPNRLEGGAGNDKISARGGADVLAGDAGDDFLDGGPGTDTMNGGTGSNWCYLGERMRSCRFTHG